MACVLGRQSGGPAAPGGVTGLATGTSTRNGLPQAGDGQLNSEFMALGSTLTIVPQ
jgi:hypothetical protein